MHKHVSENYFVFLPKIKLTYKLTKSLSLNMGYMYRAIRLAISKKKEKEKERLHVIFLYIV